MIKMIILAKRRAGSSRDDLIRGYEVGHLALTEELVSSGKLPPMCGYVRNYTLPGPDGLEPEFDVITEAWYESAEVFGRVQQGMADPEISGRAVADLGSFLDLASMKTFVVEEFGSKPD